MGWPANKDNPRHGEEKRLIRGSDSEGFDEAIAAQSGRPCRRGLGPILLQQGFGANSAMTGMGGVSGNDDEVIVVMNTTSEPDAGFDPCFNWGCGEHVHEPLIQSTLITTDENLAFVNDLATSYAVAEDAMSWTFDIRDDVVFSDGTALTARDVAFSINAVKASAGSQLDLSYVDRAVAETDFRAVIYLTKPYNALLYTLAVVGIIPEASYDAATYGQAPIGSGRYRLVQWDRGQQVILEANPTYYGTPPSMRKVTVLFMEEDAALAAARAGEVDIAYTSATLAQARMSGYSLLECATNDCRGISLTCVEPEAPTTDGQGHEFPVGAAFSSDVLVRRALNLAVDRQQLIDHVFSGHARIAYGVADGLPWASPAMEVVTDWKQAAALMEQAGWAKNDEGVYARGRELAGFTLMYPTDDSTRQAIAEEIKNQLTDFGIQVHTSGATWTYDSDGLYAHQYADPIVWGWGSNSPTQLYDLTFSTSASNFSSYRNATVDAHLNAALAAPTVEGAYNEWKLAQWDGAEGVAPVGGASWIWLANVNHLYFKRDGLDVGAQKPHPHGHGWSLVNNVDRWGWQ